MNPELHHYRSESVDDLVEEWRAVLPDADVEAKAITSRIARLHHLIRLRVEAALETVGLSDSEYRLLAGVRRSGPPFRLSPSEITTRYLPMTSGGCTALIDRLEQRGLVERSANPADRRGVYVSLTEAGMTLAERAMRAVLAVETDVVAALTPRNRKANISALSALMGAALE
ncbi:MAG: MarR family transcriptional regulator [Caulobacteraceae bacterium]